MVFKKGYKMTEEHKRKIAEANRGKSLSKESKEKNRLAHIGRLLSKETKEKIRTTMMKKGIHPDFRFGFQKGYKMSEEHKEQLKRIFLGRKLSKEHIENIKKNHKQWNLGKKWSKEIRDKMSAIRKRKIANGEIKLSPNACFKKGHKVKEEWKEACRKATTGKKHSEKWQQWRKNKIFPIKDTSIEVKIQSYLKQLGLTFYTHQYIKEIEHGYQCDILIPIQEGITKKTIIECFGTYWHNYPLSREIDIQRCNELSKQGYKVLVLWENEIKVMEVNDLEIKLWQKE